MGKSQLQNNQNFVTELILHYFTDPTSQILIKHNCNRFYLICVNLFQDETWYFHIIIVVGFFRSIVVIYCRSTCASSVAANLVGGGGGGGSRYLWACCSVLISFQVFFSFFSTLLLSFFL